MGKFTFKTERGNLNSVCSKWTWETKGLGSWVAPGNTNGRIQDMQMVFCSLFQGGRGLKGGTNGRGEGTVVGGATILRLQQWTGDVKSSPTHFEVPSPLTIRFTSLFLSLVSLKMIGLFKYSAKKMRQDFPPHFSGV